MPVDAVVEGISGDAHHVAVRSDTPLSSDDTICHGGTLSAEGFEISWTPLDSVSESGTLLADFLPSRRTRSWMSAGPPICTICGFPASVTTLAFSSACNT